MNIDVEKKIRAAGHSWYHNLEAVPGSGVYTVRPESPTTAQQYLDRYGLNKGFWKGKRVLDIGTFTGALAFYAEEQGAEEVVAIDIMDPDDCGFTLLQELRDSRVIHRKLAVYDLDPQDLGRFDIVLFFGVLYHLKHPLLALERINSMMKKSAILLGGGTSSDAWFHDEDLSCCNGVNLSKVTKDNMIDVSSMTVSSLNDLPITGFCYDHFLRDRSNWFIPNAKCIDAWLIASGFDLKTPTTSRVSPLERDWNRESITRSSAFFYGIKSGDPLPEYEPTVYSRHRKNTHSLAKMNV